MAVGEREREGGRESDRINDIQFQPFQRKDQGELEIIFELTFQPETKRVNLLARRTEWLYSAPMLNKGDRARYTCLMGDDESSIRERDDRGKGRA